MLQEVFQIKLVGNKTQPNQPSLTSRLQIKQWQWCKMATLLKVTALCNSAQYKVTDHKAQHRWWSYIHCSKCQEKHTPMSGQLVTEHPHLRSEVIMVDEIGLLCYDTM